MAVGLPQNNVAGQRAFGMTPGGVAMPVRPGMPLAGGSTQPVGTAMPGQRFQVPGGLNGAPARPVTMGGVAVQQSQPGQQMPQPSQQQPQMGQQQPQNFMRQRAMGMMA